MSKWKKRSVPVLAGILVITFIMSMSACSVGRKDSSNTGKSFTGEAEEYTLPFSNGETIVYSGPDSWYPPASLAKNLPVWQEVEKRTGVKIKWEVAPATQWNTSMMTRIASGQKLPDVMGLPPWHNADIYKLSEEQVIIPLTELIQQYAPNIKKLFERLPNVKKQLTAPNGNIYTIDELFEANEYFYTILIRKDWLDYLGLQPPKTVDDWYSVLQAFKDEDPNRNGKPDEIPLSAAEGYRYDYFASGFGLPTPVQDTWPDKDGKLVYQRSTQGFKEFLTFMNRLYTAGLLDQQYAVGQESKFEALVAQNIVGATIGGGDWAARYEAGLKASGVEGAQYMLINPPVDKDGKLTIVKRAQLGGQHAISADCKNPALAMKLIDYLWASEEGTTLLHFGIEGKSYTKDAEGKPVLTDWVMNHPEKLDPGSALRSIGAWPPLFDRQTKEFMSSFFPKGAVEYYEANGKAGIYVEPFPRIIPKPEEVERASAILGDIQTYVSEMSVKFILNQEPLSKFDSEYLPKLKQMYLDDYLKLRQEQYDRFVNTK